LKKKRGLTNATRQPIQRKKEESREGDLFRAARHSKKERTRQKQRGKKINIGA